MRSSKDGRITGGDLMNFALEPLPYPDFALEPHLGHDSAST